MKDLYKSITDERLILDVVAPGYDADSVVVKTARVNAGEAFKVTVEGKYAGRTNKDGEKALAGAEFTLKKADDNWKATGEALHFTKTGGDTYRNDANGGSIRVPGVFVLIANMIASPTMARFASQ